MGWIIGPGNSFIFRQGGGNKWSSYWATHLFGESDLSLRATGRSGVSIPASVGDSPTILFPYYKKNNDLAYAAISDNGALDVGTNTEFTVCGWASAEALTSYTTYGIAGKHISGAAPQGYYGVRFGIPNATLYATINPTGGARTITGPNMSAAGWFFYLMDVNQTTGKFRLFYWLTDGSLTQHGADIAFTGTFPAVDNAYKFFIGGHQNAVAAPSGGLTYHADTWVIKKILTVREITDLRNNRYSATIAKTDILGYWPCNTWKYLYDLSGNGRHLTVNDINDYGVQSEIGHSIYGSPWNLNKGCSIYKLLKGKPTHLFIPYDYDGVALVTPPVPSKAVYTATHTYLYEEVRAGNVNYHNLSESKIRFPAGSWDRSNTTIWSALARAATTYYDVSNPTDWHVTELSQTNIDYWLNSDYKDVNFVKVVTDSNLVRTYLDEVYTYGNVKTDLSLKKILAYTNDFDTTFTHFARDGAGMIMGKMSHPTSVYYNGITYVVYQGADVDPYIVSYNHSTKVWTGPVKVGTNPIDNSDLGHCYPTLTVDNNGYIHVFYGAHYTLIQYSKSTSPENISAWTVMDSPGDGTYGSPYTFSTGRIYLFYRDGHPDIDGYLWGYKYSDNGGTTWSAFVTCFQEFAYMNFQKGIGDTVHVVGEGYNTRAYARENVYYAFFDGTTWKKDDGTELTLPVVLTATDIKVHDSSGLGIVESIVEFDADNNPYIAFCEGDNTAHGVGDHEYYFMKYTGGAWVVTDLGESTRLVNNGCPVLIINSASNIEYYMVTSKAEGHYGGYLEKWISTDGGATFTFDSIAIKDNVIIPSRVHNNTTEGKIVCGEYRNTTKEFVNKGFLYGDSGLIKNYKGSNWQI